MFCVRDFKFLGKLNRGVPPMKVNFYCFVRKTKLGDRIMYVGVAKMTLKQTNTLHFANGMMGC
jgi:hypothetical protein